MDTARLIRLASASVRVTGAEPADTELLRRYANERNEAAFAELVQRNGPLVLRTCRHVLGSAGAEDAFQATFLLLARSAGRLTQPGSLAGWLHAAAVRIAHRARREEERRREREAARRMPPQVPDDLTWREVREVIDTELAALPEKYRVPLVLCYLQELSYEEAARRVGCPVGALRGRLERGKERLRQRLSRNGLPLLAPTLVLGAPPPVPAALIETTLGTVRAARAGGSVSPAVAALVAPKTGPSTALLTSLAVALAAIGTVLACASPPSAPPVAPAPRQTTGEVSNEAALRTDPHGDALPAGAVMRLGTTRFRHGSLGTAVAFSPDGKEIASAAYDHTVRIWDRQTGRELRRLKGPFDTPHAVAYADGGTRIVTAENRGTSPNLRAGPVRLWDAKTGELVRTIAEDVLRNQEALAISPDGKTLAFRTGDAVVLHAVVRGGLSGELPVRNRCVPHLAFNPDGTRLAVFCGGRWGAHEADPYGVRLFDLTRLAAKGQEAKPLWVCEGKETGPDGRRDNDVVFSPDGKYVLVSFNGGDARAEHPLLLDATTGKEVRRFVGRQTATGPFLFLPGGKQVVAIADYYGPARVWDVDTGQSVTKLPWNDADVYGGMALSPDGKTVATAGYRAIRLWDRATWKELHPTHASLWQIDQLVLLPDGRVATVATDDGEFGARIWDLGTGRQCAAISGGIGSIALAQNGETIATAPFSGGPAVAEPTTGRLLRHASEKDASVGSLVYGLAGRILIGSGNGLHLWDAETLKPLPPLIAKFPERRGARKLGVTSDGARLVVPEYDGVIRVWDLASRKVVSQLDTGHRGLWPTAFSADRRLVATAHFHVTPTVTARAAPAATTIKLWDLTAGNVWTSFTGPNDGTNCLAFSPDERLLATGSHDSVVRVYELATGKCRAEFCGHEGPVSALAFTPDGKRLLSGGSDTTVLVWDLIAPRPGKLGPTDAGSAWTDLADADAATADRAIRYLVTAPDSVALLGKRLKPEPEPDAKHVRHLIEQLASPVFADREQAQEELEHLGAAVLPALRRAAQATESAEAARRLRELVSKVDRVRLSGEALRTARAVEVLERIGRADARAVLLTLAGGARDARATSAASAALDRLKGRK